LAFTDDMLGQGFVRSLAKPGGNDGRHNFCLGARWQATGNPH
jgi:hypothetical protein